MVLLPPLDPPLDVRPFSVSRGGILHAAKPNSTRPFISVVHEKVPFAARGERGETQGKDVSACQRHMSGSHNAAIENPSFDQSMHVIDACHTSTHKYSSMAIRFNVTC